MIRLPIKRELYDYSKKLVEENNFGIRKRLLEYDDVMNQQREIVYDRRDYALHGDDISKEVSNIKNEYIIF